MAKHNGLLVVRSRCISFVATVGITASIFSWHWFINPLPSDEYMIEHLEQNRDEYDELIAGYIEAKQRGNDAMKSWLTSPRKVALQHKVQARDERVNPEESQWHGGIEVNSGLGDRKKIVYSMEFHLAGATTRSIREGSTIWKSYWYFPEAQPLTSGKSLCPSGSGKQCLGKMNIEVLPSLNNYPLFSGFLATVNAGVVVTCARWMSTGFLHLARLAYNFLSIIMERYYEYRSFLFFIHCAR
ncbi:MAG: hypothetical protein R3E63_02250 [Pseudomonadales bacterium]